MTVHHGSGLSSEPSDDDANKIRLMAEFWNALRICEDTGAASKESLEELERGVTECLYARPPDIERAESLTACAMHLMAGCSNP
jgi:hypothetical protein